MTTCTYDTGSMHGNVPVCDAPAVWRVDYDNGTARGLEALVCARHLGATRARVFPGEVQTVAVCPRCGHACASHGADGCEVVVWPVRGGWVHMCPCPGPAS